jgi:hypothetical protein
LAIFLSRRAFRDYKTLQELFAVTPTQEHRAFQIHWEEDLLEAPVFLNQSTKGAKRIENAGAFGSRHRECGIRAGFPVPPTIHDWRAEGLFLTGMHASLRVVVNMLTVAKTSIIRLMRGWDKPGKMTERHSIQITSPEMPAWMARPRSSVTSGGM